MSFTPTDLLNNSSTVRNDQAQLLPGDDWIPVLDHGCDFGAPIFSEVSLNLILNPNLTSSHLFRADILFDSHDELTNVDSHERIDSSSLNALVAPQGFQLQRTLVRRLVPRNPQLDRPISQLCYLLQSNETSGPLQSIMILEPVVEAEADLPWYHPSVQAIAYWYTPSSKSTSEEQHQDFNETGSPAKQSVCLLYRLFPDQDPTLSSRLLRTARNLLAVMYKHGQGTLAGYAKKVHHDQIISQKRVQDTYTDLKTKHAKRLCDAWVEQTEPSKHVFEDLGIAAFLIELWKDMYASPNSKITDNDLPPFPGFVDIGCGNGVLTEILLLSGYHGQGIDARRRKTWSILSKQAQSCLHERLFVPQPLFDLYTPEPSQNHSLLSKAKSFLTTQPSSLLEPPKKPWSNGIFPRGTFIISNHADELTPWTPLLAFLMNSPFLAIPCCSHNLSGDRFRAPSAYNSNTADADAPSYFNDTKSKVKKKSVAITIPCMDSDDDGTAAQPAFGPSMDTSADPPASSRIDHLSSDEGGEIKPREKPETGDLKALSQQSRSKQPSAYASLCDWVAHLSQEVGYEIEREMLRIPSTRNVGLVGRNYRGDFKDLGKDERKSLVLDIVRREGADGKSFVRRCEDTLAKSGGKGHG